VGGGGLQEARVGGMINLYKIWHEKPKGKRPLRRPWRRCKGNVKMEVKVMDLKYINYIRDGLL
jgi:hypothetical protein